MATQCHSRAVKLSLVAVLLLGCSSSHGDGHGPLDGGDVDTNATGGSMDEDSDEGSGESIDPNQPKADNPGTMAPGSDAFVGDGSHSKPCPTSHPGLGTDCGGQAHFCLYGDSVRYDCREEIYCGPEGWSALPSTCERPPSEFCPEAVPGSGESCMPWPGATEQLSVRGPQHVCEYSDGIQCGCFEGGGDEGSKWQCDDPPGGGCPTIPPNYGTPCDVQGRECVYGSPCTTGARLICRNATWVSLEDGGICIN